MSAAVSIESGVLDGYRARLAGPEAVDELVTADGLRADQASLAATVDALGLAGLQGVPADAAPLGASAATGAAPPPAPACPLRFRS